MSRVDRLIGMARSVAIYHAIPWRQRGLRRLYAGFVKTGELVFDVGAHAGNLNARLRGAGLPRRRARASAGLRTPPEGRVRSIAARGYFVEAAVGATVGKVSLSISDRTPTVTTLATGWRDARSREADFGGVRWNRRVEVEMTTLDELIANMGSARFRQNRRRGRGAGRAGRPHAARGRRCRSIDVPAALAEVRACVDRLGELGTFSFNWSAGESFRMESASWLSGAELLSSLDTPRGRQRSGDVYARLSR